MTMRPQTLCWTCKNAVPTKTSGCVWSERFEPVAGWTAEKNEITGAFRVFDCPHYKPGSGDSAEPDDEAAERLMAAVVKQVCGEYKEAYQDMILAALAGKAEIMEHKVASMMTLHKYFDTEYAKLLTRGHPQYIRTKVKDEAAEEIIREVTACAVLALKEEVKQAHLDLNETELDRVTEKTLQILRKKKRWKK